MSPENLIQKVETSVRTPNEDELVDLVEFFKSEGCSEERALEVVDLYDFAVVESFSSTHSEYTGNVIFALFGAPYLYRVFVYVDGKLTEQESEYHYLKED